MPKRFKSDAFEAAHETMSALHRIGAVDDARMHQFDELCQNPAEDSPATGPSFSVYKDAGGRWRWRLMDQFGKTLAISPEGFPTRSACLAVINAIKHLEDAPVQG